MRHIAGGSKPVRGFEVGPDIDQWSVVVNLFYRRQMRDIILRLRNHRHHPLQDTPVGLEEIDQGGRNDKDEAADKSTKKEKDLGSFDQFFCLKEMSGLEKIEYQETQRNQGIVDTEFQKGIGGRSQEPDMFAVQNKGRDIPAHNKHTDRGAYDRIADGIYIAEVFRSEKEGIGPEGFHE